MSKNQSNGNINDSLLDDLQWRGLIAQSTDINELRTALKKPISLYAGFDPTAPSLHIGNLVVILVLKRFQRSEEHTSELQSH